MDIMQILYNISDADYNKYREEIHNQLFGMFIENLYTEVK